MGAGATTTEIAALWRAHARIDYEWRACANQAGVLGAPVAGEAGGLFVECDALGRRAYMKPIRSDAQVCRAAREKIASDLAHDLGLAVPPVILAERGADAGAAERLVCVSLVLFPRQWSWGHVKTFLEDEESPTTVAMQNGLSEIAALALAFDTWVGQADHNDHPHNIVFGYDCRGQQITESSWVFLDYACSLGMESVDSVDGCRSTWADPTVVCQRAGFPKKLAAQIGTEALQQAVERIAAFDIQEIGRIVDRIPDAYLPETEKAVIARGLSERRTLVREVFFPTPAGAAPCSSTTSRPL